MAVTTVTKTIGTGGNFTTLQLWNDGAPANLVTAERSNCTSFAVAAFVQGENLTFAPSGATGKLIDTDSTGVGTGTYITYGITAGDPATADVITGVTSGATASLTSGTANFVGVIWQGQCKNQEFVNTTVVLTVTGSTSSAACYKELTTVAGASFRDHANVATNALRYDSTLGAAIRTTASGTSTIVCTEANFRMSKLQIKASGPVSRASSFAGLTQLIDGCIFEGSLIASSSANGTILIGNGATPTLQNCVIIQTAPGADHIIATGTGSPNFYNCTIVVPIDITPAAFIFLSGASGTITVQNCGLFSGLSTSTIHTGSATFTCTTCVSDISGVSGVTQAPYANEYVGMGQAAMDLRLSRTSLQIDTGTTDATHAATGIVGTTRPQGAAYDMGAWESPYTAPSATTKLIARVTQIRRNRAHSAIFNRKKLLCKDYY